MARKTKNVTLTIPPERHEWAVSHAKESSIVGGFSAYVTQLIHEDSISDDAPKSARALKASKAVLAAKKAQRSRQSASPFARK